MGGRINYSGLVIAGIGFFLTRFTVTLAIYEDPVRFYLAGVLPLVLGLGLAAFGVALAVADVEASLVRTMATWCVVGAGTMLVLVVLTLLGSTTGGMPDLEAVRSRTYLSNFLIGGSVGGTLTGLYASRNRRQQTTLQQQANRLEVLNRLLRHEVLNALTAIRGYATLTTADDGADDLDARAVVEQHSDAIESTINEVKYLTRSARTADGGGVAVDLGAALRDSVATVRERHPDAEIALDVDAEPPPVLANERLEQVFSQLIENAVVHSGTDEPSVAVTVTADAERVRVAVADEGPGLPASKQRLLEDGEIGEFDNPGAGYGLNVARLLVESYRGAIETDVDESGSTVTVELSRAEHDERDRRPLPSRFTGVRPALPHLVVTFGAALVAGVLYGLAAEQLGGSIGVIGVLYGVQHPVVGWITHQFHSIVFAFVFAGLVSVAPSRYRTSVPAAVAIGVGWALVLWFFAAGVVSPVWLRLLGIPAPIPSLSDVTLVAHLAWGGSLGLLSAYGYRSVGPSLDRLRAHRG